MYNKPIVMRKNMPNRTLLRHPNVVEKPLPVAATVSKQSDSTKTESTEKIHDNFCVLTDAVKEHQLPSNCTITWFTSTT